ncbi:unnamed protein product, partial [Musa hybrid cultivar]
TKADASTSSTVSKPGHELLLFEALREGLEEEMDRDPRVCVMGEDEGHYGGSDKVSKGLSAKYGDLRVLDTPLAENSLTGLDIGAAMTGLRPLIEGMNMDFLPLAYNQISNDCGMLHYTSGGQFKIPMSYFQSITGLQIERILDDEYALCLEEAEIHWVNKGYDPEVIDIRSLKPFDVYNTGKSVKKTHRVLNVEECMRTGGIGASLRAAIIDNFWDYLDAPIMCLSSQDVPTPYAGTLEWTVVQPAQIVAAVEQLCQ